MSMCYSPILIKVEGKKQYMQVPCGKCLECKKKYQNDWCIRMYEALEDYHLKGVFFTLTYSEDTVPKNYVYDGHIYRSEAGYAYKGLNSYDIEGYEHDGRTINFNSYDKKQLKEFYAGKINVQYDDLCVVFNSVRKKDVQDWIKRGRYYLNKEFKYFITSEYGPGTLRPHYHGIIFGVDEKEIKSMMDDWEERFGMVSYGNVDPAKGGIRYVSKYCSKGIFEHPFCSRDFYYFHNNNDCKEFHSKHYERCLQYFGMDEPLVDSTFHLVSKNLGIGFIKDIENQRYRQFGEFELQYCYEGFCLAEDGSIIEDELLLSERKLFRDYCNEKSRFGRFEYVMAVGKEYYKKGVYFLPSEGKDIIINKVGDIYLSDGMLRTCRRIMKKNRYRFVNYGNKEQKQDFTFSLPKYYSQKMFGDTLQNIFKNIVLQEHDDLFREQLGVLASGFDGGENAAALYIVQQEQEAKKRRKNDSFRSQIKYLQKSQL